jgi:programmed cell death protein 5
MISVAYSVVVICPSILTLNFFFNMQPTSIDLQDLPAGFTATDPYGGSSSSSSNNHRDGDTSQQQNQERQDQIKESVLSQALTPDALERLRRIKLVKPTKAIQIENSIASLAISGQLSGRITDAKLIEMIERQNAVSSTTPSSSSSSSLLSSRTDATSTTAISFQRKKYANDSDDDNDDDLM